MGKYNLWILWFEEIGGFGQTQKVECVCWKIRLDIWKHSLWGDYDELVEDEFIAIAEWEINFYVLQTSFSDELRIKMFREWESIVQEILFAYW